MLYESLSSSAAEPKCRATMARSAPRTASRVPSRMKGPRMKLLEAPTRRMMPISRRRAVMARRIVLLMKTNDTKVSSKTSATAAMRM